MLTGGEGENGTTFGRVDTLKRKYSFIAKEKSECCASYI